MGIFALKQVSLQRGEECMLKRFYQCVREYKKPAYLTLIFITGEAIMEALIPFITAQLVNRIKLGAELNELIRIGILLLIVSNKTSNSILLKTNSRKMIVITSKYDI